MAQKKADLHCHSFYSDGSFRPEELVDMALAAGFFGLSITDHDSLTAFSEARAYASACGIWLIPGVEISTQWTSSGGQGESIHVLGYAFDPNSPSLEAFCATHRRRREQRNALIVERLAASGMPISMDEVRALSPNATTYGRPHLALALVNRGYVPTVQVAFARYLGEGKPCYVSGEKWTVREAIDAVHEAKGKAVLAHPHLIKTKRCLKDLLNLPFDGLECYYGLLPSTSIGPWCALALSHGLFVTGGSDFHGPSRPGIPFGSSWTPEETIDLLQKHFEMIGG